MVCFGRSLYQPSSQPVQPTKLENFNQIKQTTYHINTHTHAQRKHQEKKQRRRGQTKASHQQKPKISQNKINQRKNLLIVGCCQFCFSFWILLLLLVVLYAFLSGQYSCHLTVCFVVVVCPRPHLYIFFNRHPLSVYLSTLCTQNHHHPPPPLRSYTPPPFKCVISQPNFSLIRFYGKRRKQNM